MFSKFVLTLVSFITLLLSPAIFADIVPSAGISAGAYASGYAGLGGTGYWGGTQGCGYQTRTSKAAVDVSDEEKRERKEIKKREAELKVKEMERDRANAKMELATKRIERHFESEVAEFLMGTHMEKMNLCENYRTYPEHKCPTKTTSSAGKADEQGEPVSKEIIQKCKGLDEVPPLLKESWIREDGTGYCSANSKGSRGGVNSSICSDDTLKPQDTKRRSQTRECSQALVDYRKAKIEYDNAQDKVDRYKEEIEDRTLAIADARERAKIEREYKLKTQLEGECEDCDKYDRDGVVRPKRDWWSTAANVVGGLGLMWYGKKIDESAQEYNAQLGYPSNNSYGYPFVTAGVYGVINGLVGPGAYGCAGGVGGGGFPYGAAGAYGPYGLNGYGPNGALGGAFGYPQSMYGSPWGGGAYQPGFGPYGIMAGPNGGWPWGLNGQAGIGVPVNGMIGGLAGGLAGGIPGGGMALCITWPCQTGGYAGGIPGGGIPGGGLIGGLAGGLAGGIPGGIPGGGYAGGYVGGLAGGLANIGVPASGGYAGGIPGGGIPGGGMIGTLANGMVGGMGSYLNNPMYQQQMMQQQQYMLQMQMQQQQQMMQYYQAQAQAQAQAYQRQVMVAQQAQQVQSEINSLQMRLQMLLQGAYSGGGGYGYGAGGLYGYGGGGGGLTLGGAVGGIGSIYFGAQATVPGAGSFSPITQPYPINGSAVPGTGTAIPGTGTGRGR